MVVVVYRFVALWSLLVPKIKLESFQTLDSVPKAVTDAIKNLQKLISYPGTRRGEFADPSMLHQRDVILKGTKLM
jgi:hypothetical protein